MAVGPDPAGAALCEDQGEGTHTERFEETKGIKVRVVCRDSRTATDVRYGWYFDELGRKIREEDLIPGAPEKSRILVISYSQQSAESNGTKTYDGNGKPLASTTATQEAAAARNKGPQALRTAYHDYINACEESPALLLHSLVGNPREPQFFTKKACACIAEKAVKADDAPPGRIWKSMKTLDRRKLANRLTVAAMQNLGECLCPEAFPDSQLAGMCAHAADVEKAWTPE